MFLRTVLVSFSMPFVCTHHSWIFICASLTLDIEDHRSPCLCFSYQCSARQSHFFLLETGKKKQYLVTHSTPTSTTTPGPQSNAGGTLHIPTPSPPLLTCLGSVVSTYVCVCVSQRYLTVVVPCTVTLPQHNNFAPRRNGKRHACQQERKSRHIWEGCIHGVYMK